MTMGFLDLFTPIVDFFTSTRRPKPGTPVLPREEVYQRLMGLNRPTAPYRIVDGEAEGVDLVAEWRIVDAQWYEIFAKAGLEKVFRVFLTFDPEKHEVRALDKEYTLEWRTGVPSLSLSVKTFRGQKQSIEFGKAYAFTETLRPGVVYDYRFDTRELKGPIQEAVTSAGWTYRGVAL
jgi:hypothetical protein